MALSTPRSIAVVDGLSPEAVDFLKENGAEVAEQHFSPEELAQGALAEHDAVIIRTATKLDEAAIRAAAGDGKLRVIARAGVGVDNVDLAAAQAHGCWVLNTPGVSTPAVVELTLAHMLAAARGLQEADQGLKTGKWLKGKARPPPATHYARVYLDAGDTTNRRSRRATSHL